jgi:hypothetical protein
MIRPDIHARFVALVARAIERSDREYAEHLARLAAAREPGGRARSRANIVPRRRPQRSFYPWGRFAEGVGEEKCDTERPGA